MTSMPMTAIDPNTNLATTTTSTMLMATGVVSTAVPPFSVKPKWKLLIVCPTIYALPLTGYGGTEQICLYQMEEFQKAGHQVSVVACEGSKLPEGVELIPVPLRCTEEHAYSLYQKRLESGEFQAVFDSTFGYWSIQSNIGREPQIPIIKTHHTDPVVWASGPPIQYPGLVGISDDHARRLSLAYGTTVERVYNGIDLSFYQADPTIKRSGKLLFIGRYTNEKGILQSMQLAKRLRMPLDCYGDTEIVGDPGYVDRCRREADGVMVRMFPGVSRQETVKLYSSYRALLFTPQWNEPFSLTICEAQACQLPVITLARGSMPEVVKHGVSGLVYQTMEELEAGLKNNEVSQIKPEDCRAWASNFSKEKMGQNYLALVQRWLDGGRW